MQTLTFEIRATAPLLMHNETLANPLNEMAIEMKKLTSKRQKTEDDYLAIAKLEWMCGLYWDKHIGPYIPSRNILACFYGAGALKRKGQSVKRGLIIEQDLVPIDFDGPRDDPEKLFANQAFVDMRTVIVKGQKGRVLRTRPIFHDWSLTFSVLIDQAMFDMRDVRELAEMAGRYIGLGDFRPRFGRFEVLAAV